MKNLLYVFSWIAAIAIASVFIYFLPDKPKLQPPLATLLHTTQSGETNWRFVSRQITEWGDAGTSSGIDTTSTWITTNAKWKASYSSTGQLVFLAVAASENDYSIYNPASEGPPSYVQKMADSLYILLARSTE